MLSAMDDKAVRGVPWTIITFGATKVVGSLTTIVLARLLVPSDFGLFALATLGLGLLSIFNGNWLGATLIVRADMEDARSRGTVLTLVLLSGAILAAALALLAPLAADAFNQPRLDDVLYVYAGVLLFSGVSWFYGIVFQREMEFRGRFAGQIARAIAMSAVSLAMGFAGAGVWSLVIGTAAGYMANGVVLIALAPYRVRPAFDRTRVRDIVGGSRGFLGQELAEFIQQNADYVAIGQVLGASQLGFYSMAYRQAELPHFSIADPLGQVTFPAFAKLRHEGKDIKRPFLTALRLVCLLTCPLGLIMSAGAHPFTLALFGPKWLPMTHVLAVMGIWAIVRPLQVTIGRLLNSLGAAWLYGRISVVGLVPFAGATVFAAHQWGITGVGAVLLAYMTIIAVLLMRVVARRAEIPVSRQWAVLSPMLLASAVSWVATRATADALGSVAPALALAATVAVCLTTYIAGVAVADREVLAIALRQARRVLPRRRRADAVVAAG
jgi:O-antigen/teichoic acid export membrane protein